MQTLIAMFSNWKTAVPGALSIVCGSADLMGLIPPPYQNAAIHVCLFLLAIGVIAAKDADKSNAVNPTAVAQTIRAILVPVLLLGLLGCSAAQIQKTQSVIVKLKADAQTVAIAGCANAPLAELLLETALELLPPGTTIDQIHAGMQLAQPQIASFCARLQQLHAPAVPIVPAGTPGLS